MTRSVRLSLKAFCGIEGMYLRHMSTTPRSISTIVTFSTLLCRSASRRMPPSPPPMIRTFLALPWAMIGVCVIIS